MVARALPGCPVRHQVWPLTIMSKNVLLGPTGEIEQGAGGEELKTGLGKRRPPLPREAFVELLLELVKIAHIARRIVALGVAKFGGAPVAGLLLLRDVDVEQFLDQ